MANDRRAVAVRRNAAHGQIFSQIECLKFQIKLFWFDFFSSIFSKHVFEHCACFWGLATFLGGRQGRQGGGGARGCMLLSRENPKYFKKVALVMDLRKLF